MYLLNKIFNVIKKIKDFFYSIFSVFCLIFIKLLNVFIIIRFNYIDRGRIGGFYPVEFYRIKKRNSKTKYFDIFLCDQLTDHYNEDWYLFWKSKFNILYLGRFSYIFCKINKKYFGKKNLIPYKDFDKFPISGELINIIDENYYLDKMVINSNILSQAKPFFNKHGLLKNQFICFHNRDKAFLNKYRPKIDWSYHDYRDSSIKNYVKSINYFSQKNIKAIRIGETAEEKLSIKNANIIDYPFSDEKKSSIDLSLLSESKFSILSETGLSLVPFVFRKPIVFVNWVLLEAIHTYKEGIFILKKVFSIKEKKYLKFYEIIKYIGKSGDGKYYKENFIFEENNQDDILDACLEMNDFLDGKFKYTTHDNDLQTKFWKSLGKKFYKNKKFRIGKNFLIKNQNLI